MIVIRPITKDDLNQIYSLSARAQVGLTTLPHDKSVLKRRIEDAVYAFNKKSGKPEGETYLFVLEDTEKKKIIGISGVVSKVGGFEPFYTYQIKTAKKVSKLLKVKKDIQYLQLLRIHNGPAEIGTLFLLPEYRKHGNGRLLSLSRFLFMAQHPRRFEPKVIAELRGVFNRKDRSPFWDSVGRHFFEVDFKLADLMGMKDKSFIEDLIPQHPIYIPLLTYEVQKVIGEVHKNTKPAVHLLSSEGFEKNDWVDIFEAGPVMIANTKNVRTIRQSVPGKISRIVDKEPKSAPYLIASSGKTYNFRVVIGQLLIKSNGNIHISEKISEALNLKTGSRIRYCLLKGKKRSSKRK